MKLYSIAPQDCSGKARWMLHELGIPFEDIRLAFKNGDLKTTEYLAKNPIGQAPVLDDDGLVLFESYAIVHYLADKYSEKGLAPPVTNFKQRTTYMQWMFFCTDTVEDFFSRYQKLPKMTEDYKKQWGDYIQDKTQKVMLHLEKQMKEREYILGSFSVVDTCMGYAIDGICEEVFFNDYPHVKAYYERLSKREACIMSEIFKRN